jgi:hypothetical protein
MDEQHLTTDGTLSMHHHITATQSAIGQDGGRADAALDTIFSIARSGISDVRSLRTFDHENNGSTNTA